MSTASYSCWTGIERAGQHMFATRTGQEVYLRTRKVDRRRYEEKAITPRHGADDVGQARPPHEDVVQGRTELVGIEAE